MADDYILALCPADNIQMKFPFPGVTALKGQVAEKNVEAEKQAAAMEAQRQAALAAEREHEKTLLKSVDLKALDKFIKAQDLNPFESKRFKQNKRDSLRVKYIKSFAEQTA